VIREEHIDLGQSGSRARPTCWRASKLDGDPDGAVRLQKAFKGMMSRTPAIAKRVNISMFDNKDDVGAAGPRIALGNLGVETIRRY
jgi:hypothetical protein